jgi:hypothetical protein
MIRTAGFAGAGMTISSIYKRVLMLALGVVVLGLPHQAGGAEAHGQLTLNTLPSTIDAESHFVRFDFSGRSVSSGEGSFIVQARHNRRRWLEIGLVAGKAGTVVPRGYRLGRPYSEPCPGADLEFQLSADGSVGACPLGIYHRIVPQMADGWALVLFDPASGMVLRRLKMPLLPDGAHTIAFVGDDRVALLESDRTCPFETPGNRLNRVWIVPLKSGQKQQEGACASGLLPYGDGRLALRWGRVDDARYSFGNDVAQRGDLIAVTDDAHPIIWHEGAVVGFGAPIRLTSRPIATWVR